MIILSWNCMTPQGRNFGRTLKNYCNGYNVDMVALQETRCSGVKANNTTKG